MMTRRGQFCVFLILVFSNLITMAQENGISMMFFVGANFPIDQFGEKIGDNPRITRRFGFDYGNQAGLAASGLAVGAEMNQQVLLAPLNWIVSVKCLLNPVDHSSVESFFTNELTDSGKVSFKNGLWLNIPIFTGFSYRLGLGKKIQMYGLLQGGLNFTQQPYRKIYVNGDLVEKTTFRLTPDFGYEAGLGLAVFDKYEIGVRYINLSTPRYEGTRTLNESFFKTIPKREENVDGDERPVSMFIVILGYRL